MVFKEQRSKLTSVTVKEAFLIKVWVNQTVKENFRTHTTEEPKMVRFRSPPVHAAVISKENENFEVYRAFHFNKQKLAMSYFNEHSL